MGISFPPESDNQVTYYKHPSVIDLISQISCLAMGGNDIKWNGNCYKTPIMSTLDMISQYRIDSYHFLWNNVTLTILTFRYHLLNMTGQAILQLPITRCLNSVLSLSTWHKKGAAQHHLLCFMTETGLITNELANHCGQTAVTLVHYVLRVFHLVSLTVAPDQDWLDCGRGDQRRR